MNLNFVELIPDATYHLLQVSRSANALLHFIQRLLLPLRSLYQQFHPYSQPPLCGDVIGHHRKASPIGLHVSGR